MNEPLIQMLKHTYPVSLICDRAFWENKYDRLEEWLKDIYVSGLEAAIESVLNEQQREVLRLSELYHKDEVEIGQIMNLNPASVRNLRSGALHNLLRDRGLFTAVSARQYENFKNITKSKQLECDKTNKLLKIRLAVSRGEEDINIHGMDKDISTEDLCIPKTVKDKLTGHQVFNLYELRHCSRAELRNFGLTAEEVDQIETALAKTGRQLGFVL